MRGHERVELYLCFPYGSYGLYRALVPVQGCTLPLPHCTSRLVVENINTGHVFQLHHCIMSWINAGILNVVCFYPAHPADLCR
jgi:hypothetical protein